MPSSCTRAVTCAAFAALAPRSPAVGLARHVARAAPGARASRARADVAHAPLPRASHHTRCACSARARHRAP
eukprot:5338289-Pleurochrysis_carterae.AAC.1